MRRDRSPAPPSPHTRRAVAFGVLALVAAIVAFCALPKDPEKPKATAQPPAAPAQTNGPRVVFGEQPAAPPPAEVDVVKLPPPDSTEPPPVIDEIIVEKPEVCSGEENLVTVRAHTVNGTDAFLHYTIGPEAGVSVPVRQWTNGAAASPTHFVVTVFGRNNVSTTVDLPNYTLKDCTSLRNAFVDARLRPNTFGEYELEAHVVDAPSKDAPKPPPFEGVSWQWSFGDGTSETTSTPFVVHSYEERPQTAMFSSFLITVEAIDAKGEKVVGRRPLQVINSAFEDLAVKHTVSLLIQLNPRFPELSNDGVVRQGVRLFHIRKTSVHVTKVTAITNYADGKGSKREEVPALEVLGAEDVPPGHGLDVNVALDAARHPDVFSYDFLVEGETPDGLHAYGSFSVMRPPEKPTKDKNDPVTDPLLKAKILAARKILDKEFVTDEDIWMLEREGKLAGLTGDESAPTTPLQPGGPPKPHAPSVPLDPKLEPSSGAGGPTGGGASTGGGGSTGGGTTSGPKPN